MLKKLIVSAIALLALVATGAFVAERIRNNLRPETIRASDVDQPSEPDRVEAPPASVW